MKKNHLYLLSVLILSILVFASCESKDGDWDAMKWKTDVKIDKGKVTVPVNGGTYVFKCKNYGSFWLSTVSEDDKEVSIDNQKGGNAIGEWSSVNIEKNVMTVIISPNDSDHNRLLKVSPTAGDIFSHFSFNQAGKND